MDYDNELNTSEKKNNNTTYLIFGIGCLAILCLTAVVIGVASFIFVAGEAQVSNENPEIGSPFTENSESSESVPQGVDSRSPAFLETFNEVGLWDAGAAFNEEDQSTVEADGTVSDGIYDFTVFEPNALFWANGGTAGFGDGVYEVEATAVSGPLDNGFGLVFMYDNSDESFYLLEVSSDGWVWLGYCKEGCAEVDEFVRDGWFEHRAVNKGLNAMNRLRVVANNGNLTFYVNNIEVGQIQDTRLTNGDIGLLVETFDQANVQIYFDNFSYTPNE